MPIWTDKNKTTEAGAGTTIGDTAYNDRGQTMYWNGSKWSATRPQTAVTVTGTDTNKDGSKTVVTYGSGGITREYLDSTGTSQGTSQPMTMEQNKEARQANTVQEGIKAIESLGGTATWRDGYYHITDAAGNKYKTDNLYAHEMNASGTGGGSAATSIWSDLRAAAGLSPTTQNPWYEGADGPGGVPGPLTVTPDYPGGGPTPGGPTGPPPPQPPTDPTQPKPTDPTPNPPGPTDPNPGGYETGGHRAGDFLWPVFAGGGSKATDFYNNWLEGSAAGGLLEGYGPPQQSAIPLPQYGGGGGGQQQQPDTGGQGGTGTGGTGGGTTQPPPGMTDKGTEWPNQPHAADFAQWLQGLTPEQQAVYQQIANSGVDENTAMQMFQQWINSQGAAA